MSRRVNVSLGEPPRRGYLRVGSRRLLVLDHGRRQVSRWFSAVVVTSFSPFFDVFPFSKSHTPAARRTGKLAKSRGEAGSEAVVCVALSKQSLCELRSMQQLPQKLHIVVEALCVLTQLQVCCNRQCYGFLWRGSVVLSAHPLPALAHSRAA